MLFRSRGRDPRALADQMEKLLTSLARTAVADNLLWSLADLDEHELANAAAARSLYDRIPVEYSKSGLRDDARWHGARISRAMGDPEGAVKRLRGLLGTRDVAWLSGSYFSIWAALDAAILGALWLGWHRAQRAMRQRVAWIGQIGRASCRERV